MRIVIIFYSLFLFSHTTFSQSNVTSGPSTCYSLEGVPLPNCKFTRYHSCNSGGPGQCVYYKLKNTIKKVDNPAVSTCANNNVTCTQVCGQGPDSNSCTLNCQCNSPIITPTACRQQCDKCKDSAPFDSGVYCKEFCGDPKCPGTLRVGNEIYERGNSATPTCTAAQLCAQPNPADPQSAADCPSIPPPDPQPFDYEACCYTTPTLPPHANTQPGQPPMRPCPIP